MPATMYANKVIMNIAGDNVGVESTQERKREPKRERHIHNNYIDFPYSKYTSDSDITTKLKLYKLNKKKKKWIRKKKLNAVIQMYR